MEGILVNVLPELVGDKYLEIHCTELSYVILWAGSAIQHL